VLLVLATARGALAPPRGSVGRPVAAIGVLDVGANVLFTAASARANPAAVAVLGSLYPVVTVLLARALLHERLAPPQAAAVVVALFGVVLIGAGG
jgi:drug/metabolite transporter (DMT)-like permease